LRVVIKEENMACISPDGKPTESGTKVLRALQAGLKSPEEIARDAGLPLFRVRSGLRELTQAGLADQKGDSYKLSEKGAKLLK
jgi:DNA-binding IclR family transcriptional regulator